MKLSQKIIAGVGAPALLAGLLLTGSAGLTSADTSLSKLSDRITYTASLIQGGTHLTINSTSCTVHEAVGGVPDTTSSCHLGGAGTNLLSVAITGSDGQVAYQETFAGPGCTSGTGIEIDPSDGSSPEPVQVVDSFTVTPVAAPSPPRLAPFWVYEAGAGKPATCTSSGFNAGGV